MTEGIVKAILEDAGYRVIDSGIEKVLREVSCMNALTCSAFSRQTFLEDGGLWKGQILLFELVGRQVVQAAVRPDRVVMAPPSLDDHRRLAA